MNRFEAMGGDGHAMIEFRQYPGAIIFYSLILRQENQSAELQERLIKYVLDYAKENELKIIPLCPFIKKYINRRQSEYKCVGKIFEPKQ